MIKWTKLGLIWFWISQMIRKKLIVLMKTERGEDNLIHSNTWNVSYLIVLHLVSRIIISFIIWKVYCSRKHPQILLKDKNWGQETIRIFYEGKSNLFSISLLHMPFSKCNPLNATSCRVKLGILTINVDKAYLFFLHIWRSYILLVEYI